MSSAGQQYPDWFNEMQAKDAAANATAAAPQSQEQPAWFKQMESERVASQPPQPAEQPTDWGAAKNFLTGLLRVPGAVAGAPHAINHAANWAVSKVGNAITGGNITADQIEQNDPVARVLPTSEGVDKIVFGATGVKPYEPQSVAGRVGQAAVTGAGAGLVDPLADAGAVKATWNAFKSALGSSAAQGVHEVAPDSDILPVLAALTAHSGTGLAGKLATGASGLASDAIRQVVAPKQQGVTEAARVLARDPLAAYGEGIVQPTGADLATARDSVRAATDDLGEGLQDWQAGGELRGALQKRVDDLSKTRDEATAPFRDARDASSALINTDPVFAMIDNKLRFAAGPQAVALKGARKDFALPDGTTRNDAQSLAATRQAINTRIGAAKSSGDNASATHLLDVRRVLDDQINSAVPEAGQYTRAYAEASKPLDPTTYGPVSKVLERDNYNSRYVTPDERIPDLFLKSQATRADMNQLVDAFGGDKQTAHGALEQHLVGKVQDAINPDGTLSQAAFDKAVRPYTRSLSMWFPDLAKKFNTAKSAQTAYEGVQTQRALGDAIDQGALRDGDGTLTAKSFGTFLKSNKDALAKSQSPAAVMRLQAIHNALKGTHPGELADVLKSEIAPAAAGFVTGGLEGGVLGTLLHKSVQGAFGARDAARHSAFADAIERAVLQPDYAAKITAGMTKQPHHVSLTRSLVRSVLSLAKEAGASGAYQ